MFSLVTSKTHFFKQIYLVFGNIIWKNLRTKAHKNALKNIMTHNIYHIEQKKKKNKLWINKKGKLNIKKKEKFHIQPHFLAALYLKSKTSSLDDEVIHRYLHPTLWKW